MTSDFIIGTHALVFLHHRQQTLSSEELAKNVCANRARVRSVMARLKAAGLVEAKRGCAGGGYCCGQVESITLKQVADALDTRFVETSWRSGDKHLDCQIASGMSGYIDGLFGALNGQCTNYLSHITVVDVEQALFHSSETTDREGY